MSASTVEPSPKPRRPRRSQTAAARREACCGALTADLSREEIQAGVRILGRLIDEAGPLLTPCWTYQGATSRGYGRVHVRKGRTGTAHLILYRLLVGPVPDGMELDHLCRVRHCCNPGHLEPVTRRENLMRGDTIVAARARQTECLRGHLYDEANTARTSRGTRRCRRCDRDDQRERRATRATTQPSSTRRERARGRARRV